MGVRSNGTTVDRYPAGWRRGDDPSAGGVLILGEHGLRLEGRRGGEEAVEAVPYTAIGAVRVGRELGDRVDGRPSIVVEQRGQGQLLIAPRGIGLVAEVADLLAGLTASAAARTTTTIVVAPLRKGAAEKARELVAAGPPFDPAEIGLSEHQVFVTEQEAVFTFSGSGVAALFDNGFRDPLVWRTLLAWRRLLAGRPRVAGATYSWPAS
jgi:hypothetical protein